MTIKRWSESPWYVKLYRVVRHYPSFVLQKWACLKHADKQVYPYDDGMWLWPTRIEYEHHLLQMCQAIYEIKINDTVSLNEWKQQLIERSNLQEEPE